MSDHAALRIPGARRAAKACDRHAKSRSSIKHAALHNPRAVVAR